MTEAAPVIFLPGAFLGRAPVDGDLADEVLDHAGAARDGPDGYTVKAGADALISRLERAATPAVLIGHSLGGMAAMSTAARRPDLVSHLVLAETSYAPAEGVAAGFAVALTRAALALTPWTAMRAAVLRGSGAPPHTRRYLNAALPRTAPAGWRRELGAALTFSGRSLLAEITAPTLVLAGARNRRTHAQARVMASEIAEARLSLIEEAGHMLHVDAPGAFARAVKAFLNRA
jgi:pimeloyl-ACP methyl ester carboxylesterase